MAPAMLPVPAMTHSPAMRKSFSPAAWAGAWPISPAGWHDDSGTPLAIDPGPAAAGRRVSGLVDPGPLCAGHAAGVCRPAATAGAQCRGPLAPRPLPELGGGAGLVQSWRDARLDRPPRQRGGMGYPAAGAADHR